MGDEIGLLVDPPYLVDPDLAGDNRWLHRPWMDWGRAEERDDHHSVTGVYSRELSGYSRPTKGRRRCMPKRPPTPFGLTPSTFLACCEKALAAAS
ncbi:MAG: hypothetical protein WA996_17480 [Candidatus Promineifilaceae bacterium]